MKQYLNLMNHVRQNGTYKEDRTGTGTYSVFGHQMRFDLAEGFPLVTTKRCHLKSIIHELLWFLQGDTNIRYLKEHNVNIWDEWVQEGTAEYVELTLAERWAIYDKDIEANQANVHREAADNPLLGLYPNVVKRLRFGTDEEQHAMLDEYQIGSWKADADPAKCPAIPRKRLVAGELGPVYGYQWRSWPTPVKCATCGGTGKCNDADFGDISYNEWPCPKCRGRGTEGIDQIANLIETLKKNPDSRRAMVSAWNPALVDQMALPPCHALFQFYSAKLTRQEREKIIQPGWDGHHSEYSAWLMNLDEDVKGDELGRMIDAKLDELGVPSRRLSCQLYQRSADIFLGVPFNIASYALLTMMVAQVTNMVPGEFIWTGGDCHLYSNHLEQADLQLTRDPLPLPKMTLNPAVKDIFGFTIDDFTLIGYDAHPHIKADVAV